MTRTYVPFETRLEQILPLLGTGMNQAEIAERIGTTRKTVSDTVVKARNRGLLARNVPSLRAAGVKEGSFREALKLLSPEARRWMYEQLPEGTTAAEFAVGCMVDQFQEETAGE